MRLSNLRCLSAALLLLALGAAPAPCAEAVYLERPDGRAPAGVIGADAVRAGQWMLSYRYETLRFDGLRNATETVSVEKALRDFATVPTAMTRQTHRFEAAYAPFLRLGFVLAVPYLDARMDNETTNGDTFEMSSSGVGDLELTGQYTLTTDAHNTVHLTLGLTMPTGSIDLMETSTDSATAFVLPYALQMGSGTWDVVTGLAGQHFRERVSIGYHARRIWRPSDNDRGYKASQQTTFGLWVAAPLGGWLSVSARGLYEQWSDVSGGDERMDPRASPTFDPARQGGERWSVPVGITARIPRGIFAGHRFMAEAIIPVYQDLNGPQLEAGWGVVLAWRKTFG
jgi:hypothetical protein